MAKAVNTVFRTFWKPKREMGATQPPSRMDQYLHLLLPDMYGISKQLAPREELDLSRDVIHDTVVAKYYIDGRATGDEIIVVDAQTDHRVIVEQYRSRVRTLVERGRERFAVRRYYNVEISQPSLKDRWKSQTTKPRSRNQVVRLPSLLQINAYSWGRLP